MVHIVSEITFFAYLYQIKGGDPKYDISLVKYQIIHLFIKSGTLFLRSSQNLYSVKNTQSGKECVFTNLRCLRTMINKFPGRVDRFDKISFIIAKLSQAPAQALLA